MISVTTVIIIALSHHHQQAKLIHAKKGWQGREEEAAHVRKIKATMKKGIIMWISHL